MAGRFQKHSLRFEVPGGLRLFRDTHTLAEGVGAAALAGLIKERGRYIGRRVGVIAAISRFDP